MEMKKCPNGHYYDASVHAECPYCANAVNSGATLPLEGFDAGAENGSVTMPLGYSGGVASGSVTMPLNGSAPAVPASVAGDIGKTVALNQAINSADSDEGRTVALIQEDQGIDPVVGWLICTEGKERGRDYRIHADNNFIGRSERMDICVRGDETISRDNHAIVSFDLVDGKFYFSPGDGRAIARLNEKALFQTAELNAYDEITLGKTKFRFIPFCGKDFQW